MITKKRVLILSTLLIMVALVLAIAIGGTSLQGNNETCEMLGGEIEAENQLPLPRPSQNLDSTPIDKEITPNFEHLDYYLEKSVVDQHERIPGQYVCWNYAEDLAYDLGVKDGYLHANPFFLACEGDEIVHVIVLVEEDGVIDLIEAQTDAHVYNAYDANHDNIINYWIDSQTSEVDCIDGMFYYYGDYSSLFTEGNCIYVEDDDYLIDSSHSPSGSSNDGGGDSYDSSRIGLPMGRPDGSSDSNSDDGSDSYDSSRIGLPMGRPDGSSDSNSDDSSEDNSDDSGEDSGCSLPLPRP